MVLVAAGNRRLANKLFETYKDQMGDGGSEEGVEGEEGEEGEDAREAPTQGDRQRRIAGAVQARGQAVDDGVHGWQTGVE